MSRLTKLVTVLLIFVLSISIITATAFAVDLDDDGIDDDVLSTDYPTQVETTVYVEPTYVTDYVPETEAPTYEPVTDPYYEPETDPVVTEPYYDDWYDDSSDSQQSSDLYVGGGQTYVPPQSTAPSAALYDSDSDIDDSVLSKNDWKDISANLKNAGDDGGSDDFNFIKKNNSTSDNGEWMLVCGIICLILSAAGIAYLIFSAVRKKGEISGAKASDKRKYAYAGTRNESSGRYSDGYSSESARKRQLDRSRRFDTADVRLPKSSANRYKNNGRRYK